MCGNKNRPVKISMKGTFFCRRKLVSVDDISRRWGAMLFRCAFPFASQLPILYLKRFAFFEIKRGGTQRHIRRSDGRRSAKVGIIPPPCERDSAESTDLLHYE